MGEDLSGEATPVAGAEGLWASDDASIAEDPFPTTQMAAGAAGGAMAANMMSSEGVPGGYAAGGGFAGEEPLPWYKQRGPLIAAIVGGVLAVLLAVVLGVWLFGSNDDGPGIANRVIITLVDETGETVERELTGDVVGPDEFPESFVWLRPANAIAPEPAVAPPSDDDVEFRWAATEEVGSQELWLSKFALTERLPKGWWPPSEPVECILEREGVGDSTLEMSVQVKPRKINKRRTVTYRFPDHVFQPGDTVRCTLVSTAPDPTATTTTTTSSTTTTTVPETTTTTTTTTTVPETTTTTTTEPPPETTTTTIVETTTTTEPPPEETAWDVIQAVPELSEYVTLATACGWDGALRDPDATFTLFAPDNDALDVPPGDCPEPAEFYILPQVHDDAKLTEADLVELVGQSLEMRNGWFAEITDGPTVGGADIVSADLDASNGMTHVVNALINTSP